jgi:uncharacterized circularly permuted ATP-grasp superfamily protein
MLARAVPEVFPRATVRQLEPFFQARDVTAQDGKPRHGGVRFPNHPDAAVVEAPALAPFMPRLCRSLLGETPLLATLPSLWLADQAALRTVAAGFGRWAIRPAFDAAARPVPLACLERAERLAFQDAIKAEPWNYVGCKLVDPSVAPCNGAHGLEPQPVVLRLFLIHDGQGWRMMPGGVARVLPPWADAMESWPADGLFKDVWVLEEESAQIRGPEFVQ